MPAPVPRSPALLAERLPEIVPVEEALEEGPSNTHDSSDTVEGAGKDSFVGMAGLKPALSGGRCLMAELCSQ